MEKKIAEPEEQLFASASSGDAVVLSYLLKKGLHPDIHDQYGTTPLMEACRFGRAKCARQLVLAGADVNAKDKEKRTVLMYASDGAASSKVVELLIANGAKADERDAHGCTALMRAASRGNIAVVRALLQARAKVNVVSENDETPLTFAIVWHHFEVVKALIEAGADYNRSDETGWTPLQYALHEKQSEIANLLQDAGASLPPSPLPKGKRAASKQDQQRRRPNEQ